MNKTKNKALSTVSLMMGATLVAKVLGMLRGVLFASHYGTGELASAFSAASRIPLSFFDLLFSAAILGCFIPVYNSFGREREGDADRFACIFFNLILLLTGFLTLIGIIFARPIVNVIAGGLAESSKALAASLLRIMFPMIIFTGAAYTLVGVMQSKGRYLLPAVISAVSNLGVILYLVLLDGALGERGIYGLAAAYLVAWLLQLLTLAIPLASSGFKFRAVMDLKNPELIRALRMAPPIMIGSWLTPIAAMSGTFFASYVELSGAVTVFDTANNVYIIIVGTLVFSICNYTFPRLSRLAAEGGGEDFARTARQGLASALFIVLPFMFAALVLSGEGVTILYRRGEFTSLDAENTANALRSLLVGMPAFAVIEVMSRVFYAKGEVRPPMWAAIAGALVNIASSALFVFGLGRGIESVALACALGQWAAAVTLITFALMRLGGVFDRSFMIMLAKELAASLALFGVMLALRAVIGNDAYSSGMLGNIGSALAVFVPGAVVYLVLMKLMRARIEL